MEYDLGFSFLIKVIGKLHNYYLHAEERRSMCAIEEFKKIICLKKL